MCRGLTGKKTYILEYGCNIKCGQSDVLWRLSYIYQKLGPEESTSAPSTASAADAVDGFSEIWAVSR